MAATRPAGDALFDTSHDGLALDMGGKWTDARHVALFGRWLFLTGQRWEQDERLLHLTRTRDFLRGKADELVRWAQRQVEAGEDDEKLVETCEAIAKALRAATDGRRTSSGSPAAIPAQVATVAPVGRRPVAARHARRHGRPAHRQAAAGRGSTTTSPSRPPSRPAPPGTAAPIWQAFLERIFRHDPELVPYMQRVAGYALTGLTTEHALVFAWGEGGNGKGVFFNTLAHVARPTTPRSRRPTCCSSRNSDRHPTDMAMLHGRAARDRVRGGARAGLGRAQAQEPDRRRPDHRAVHAAGLLHLPCRSSRCWSPATTSPASARSTRRSGAGCSSCPFLQNIPKEERDPELGEKLKAEAPAILRWAIDGCLAWQRQGLNPPKSVREASESYLEGEDVLGQWLDERCTLGGTDLTPFDELFADWKAWCEANGGPAWGGKTFSKALDERGFRQDKSGSIRGFRGIVLLPKTTSRDLQGRRPAWLGGRSCERRPRDRGVWDTWDTWALIHRICRFRARARAHHTHTADMEAVVPSVPHRECHHCRLASSAHYPPSA